MLNSMRLPTVRESRVFHTLLAAVVAGCASSGVPDGASAAAPCAGASVAVRGVTVVDVVAGDTVPGRTVLVSGSRICAVMASGDAVLPESVTVLDGRGRYLMPGLWDMHVHALWDTTARDVFMGEFLAHGVTGVRDMGGDLAIALDARRRQRSGEMTAPRLVVAGAIVDGPEPVHRPISLAVSDSAGARAAVDSLASAGVDFVKVYTLLPSDAYAVLVRESRRLGLPVAGHAPAEVSLEHVAAGQRSVEHLREEIGSWCTRADSAACGPVLDAFRARRVWQTPTLVVLRAKAHLDDSALASDPRLTGMPDVVTGDWVALRRSRLRRNDSAAWAAARERWADQLWLTGAMHRAGVPLLAGTDAGVLYTYPGSSLHDELELLVQAGLTPAEALRTATVEPARYLGAVDSMGAIRPDMVADMVLLEGNPLADIRNVRRVAAVLAGGRVVVEPD